MDYVDVWQVHSADPAELAGTDVLETMLKIKAEGSCGRGYAVVLNQKALDIIIQAIERV
jgi:hypothetical protein